MAAFTHTDSWRMMQILHTSFRELAPADKYHHAEPKWKKSSSYAIGQLERADERAAEGNYSAPTVALLAERA